jgi:hypothetical protein
MEGQSQQRQQQEEREQQFCRRDEKAGYDGIRLASPGT